MGKISFFLIFPQIFVIFTYFSSKFSHFLPHFGPPGGRVAHPGRPWLRYWRYRIGQDGQNVMVELVSIPPVILLPERNEAIIFTTTIIIYTSMNGEEGPFKPN